jgi:hypothetical protein
VAPRKTDQDYSEQQQGNGRNLRSELAGRQHEGKIQQQHRRHQEESSFFPFAGDGPQCEECQYGKGVALVHFGREEEESETQQSRRPIAGNWARAQRVNGQDNRDAQRVDKQRYSPPGQRQQP